MKKSLKKVISAIAALALSTSSFVALAANDFPDVADTADYAKAVAQLTALDIVNGYEDGTFQPDKTVTRAEMTKMIIVALGSKDAAEAMSGQDTAFRDVDHNHWAAGYVSQANQSSPQFIQGMGDGTFAPEANVTYAQAVTMLVRATGYESVAAPYGYPSGYLNQAADLGILKGVTGIASDAELNRGQVAILIDNAVVDAPILGEGEWQTGITVTNGELSQTQGYAPEAKKGTNPFNSDFWTTLGIWKHDVYKVYGMVTGTRQSGASVDADEVRFEVQRAQRFDGPEGDYSYGYGNYGQSKTVTVTANVGDTDAASYLNQYAEVLIQKDDNDDYTILSFTTGGGRTDEITFDAQQFEALGEDSISYTDETGSRTTSKRLNREGVEFFVNDYPVQLTKDYDVDDFANDYLVNNYVGEVKLLDYKSEDNVTGADGRYDSVMVTYYEDAVVDEVVISNSGVATVRFLAQSNGLPANLQIDPDDEDRTVKFVGDVDNYEDLEQYDVLSIQNQPGEKLNSAENVTVTVSRAQETGTVTKKGTDELTNSDLYTINGEDYIANAAMELKALETASEYVIYLDAFGYIAYYVDGVNSKELGIIDRMYDTNGGEYKVRLIKADGSVDTYDYSNKTFKADVNKYYYEEDGETVRPVWNRVVNYSITNSGELRIKGSEKGQFSYGEYSLNTNRVKNVRLNDNTSVLDLTEYIYTEVKDGEDGKKVLVEYPDDYKSEGTVSVMGSFKEDSDYAVYGYNQSSTDNSYNFVIVLIGDGGLGIESPFAVVSTVSQGTYDNFDTTSLNIYTNGQLETNVLVDTDNQSLINELAALKTGDAFIYELNGDNMITDAQVIYQIGATGTDTASYKNYVEKVFTEASGNTGVKDGSAFDAVLADGVPTADTYEDTVWDKTRSDYAYFTFGPVIDTNTGSVTIGSLTDEGYTYTGVDTNYGFDSTYYVYAYDWGQKNARSRVAEGSRSSIAKTAIPNAAKEDVDEDGASYIDWAKYYSNPDETGYGATSINFALLKIKNGSIAEGYAITAPSNR